MDSNGLKYERILNDSTQQTEASEKSTELETLKSVSNFGLFRFSTCCEKFLLFFGVIFAIVSGVSEGLSFLVFGNIMGAVIFFGAKLDEATNSTKEHILIENLLEEVNTFGIEMAVLTAMKQSLKIRSMYFARLIYQDIPWHDQNSTGDFASRIADDLKKIEEGMNDKVTIVIHTIAFVTTCIVEGLLVGWKLTLVGLSTLPIFSLAIGVVEKMSSKFAHSSTEMFGEAGKIADETLSYIKTVVAFNGQKIESERYDKTIHKAMTNNIKKGFYDSLLGSIFNFFTYFTISLMLLYGAHLMKGTSEGEQAYNVKSITIIFSCVTVSFFYINNLAPIYAAFATAKGAAEKIFSVIQSESVINKSYEGGIEVDERLQGAIDFKAVNFSYPARKELQILRNFNLKIKPGETLALVGSSGCGKSTIVQLILRFYDPTSGQVLIDGEEIINLNLYSLRKKIGMVGQEPILFDGTIAQNIKMGNLNASQAEVEEAAKKANAHIFIQTFPDGYQTQIGERGTQLSGGQKQRIAIARALVGKPTILLLDEATSALDSHSEAVVQATLDKVSRDCTTVIVAHRLSTVSKADRIVVLSNGAVVEEGSHEDLMLAKGAYYKLVKTQSSEDETVNGEIIAECEEEVIFTNKGLTDLVTKANNNSVKSKFNISSVWNIFIVYCKSRWCLVFGIFCSILSSIGIAVTAFLFCKSLTTLTGLNREYVVHEINLLVLCIFVIGLVVIAFGTFLQSYFISLSGEHLVKNLRSLMYKSIIHQEIGWFDKSTNGVGSLGAQLAGDPASVQMAIVMIPIVVSSITIFLMLIVVGFYLSWKLMLVLSLLFPCMFMALYLEHKVLVKENQRNSEVLEDSTKLAVEVINNIRTVAALSNEEYFLDLYVSKLNIFRHFTIRNIYIRGTVTSLTKILTTLLWYIEIFYGSHLIILREIKAYSVVSISEVFIVLFVNITSTMAFLPNLIGGLVACNNIFNFFNETTTPNTNRTKMQDDKILEGDIEYNSVSFSYPTRTDIQILNDLSLTVPKGKTVALVGPSGCGKSTIVQLLERFYNSQSGKILFGKTDTAEVKPRTLRLSLGIVMQEPNLFSRSIEENIAYGNNSIVASKEEIIEAAKKANIHNFITSLPLGYETVLGERGTQLSGGQKQRIAIARAIFRNPEVLLLDEATSALDSESEKVVQEALNNAKEKRTCIVIAHRLKTIVDADIIAVINKGQVVEKGTHAELMNQKKLYWELYNKQHGLNE